MKIPEDVKKLSQHGDRQKPGRNRLENRNKRPCDYCGMTGTHPAGKNCPSYGKQYSKCQRFNHFAAVCRAGSKGRKQKQEQKQNMKRTTEESADSSTSSDERVRHLKQVKKVKTDDKNRTLTIQIEDVSVEVEPDSGAKINVMDKHQFKVLLNRSGKELTLTVSRTKLKSFRASYLSKASLQPP